MKTIFRSIKSFFTRESTPDPKQVRLSVYKDCLKLLKVKRKDTYICAFCFLLDGVAPDNTIEEFPELIAYKPEENYRGGNYWFDPLDFDTRENILNEIIKDIENG